VLAAFFGITGYPDEVSTVYPNDDEGVEQVEAKGLGFRYTQPPSMLVGSVRRILHDANVHRLSKSGGVAVGTITTKDGTELYDNDWGTGQPVVFSHGWPLSADAFEDQMFFLASRGYRCAAHDRRGHGRSSQPWDGNDMDTYADDLAALVKALNLKKVIHVGHSTGGGEVARYIGRHGTKRVAKAVLIGAVPPLMLKTEANPAGTPLKAFDHLRAMSRRTARSSGRI
jgi:alpha/beta hydrolase fold